MSETGPAPERRHAARWMKWLLLASLAVNFLLVGLIAGGAWFERRFEGASSTVVQAARFVRRLPDERRSAIRQKVGPEIQKMRELRERARAARGAARGVLTVEPFDASAYAAAQERVLAAEIELRRQGSRILVNTVSNMTAEERAGLAQMEAQRERRGGRRHHDRGRGEER